MDTDRHLKGRKTLNMIDAVQGDRIIEALTEISPDFARLVVEFPFGDICSRPGLDLKTREIATISALAAMGTASPQLKLHIQGALNVGCSQQEILEVMIQLSVYAGFPAAINGLFAAKEVFESQGPTDS